MVKNTVKGKICLEKGCHSCCIETEMPLTEADIDRISTSQNILPTDFTRKKQGLTVLKNTSHEGGKKCFFLDKEGKCSIYPIRPTGCCFYPVIWNLDFNAAEIHEYCPNKEEFSNQIELVSELVEKLVREVLSVI